MGRKRLKDNSEFSCLIKFPARFRPAAMVIKNFIINLYPAADIIEQEPEGEQKYFYVLLKIAS